MKRVLIGCIVGLLVGAMPAYGQTDAGALKRAGDEAKFRVIPRFETIPAGLSNEETQFQKAYELYSSGQHALALPIWRLLEKPEFLLLDYVNRFGAESALATGDAKLARELALKVASASVPGPEAQRFAALALLETDVPKGIDELIGFANSHPKRSTARDARLNLIQRLEKEPVRQAAQWARLLNDFPRSPERSAGLDALRRLSKNHPEAKKLLDELESPAGQLKYWNALYDAHQSQSVVDGLPGVAKTFKSGTPAWCEANFLIAHSYTKLRKHADSVIWYALVIDKCKGVGNFELRSLYLGGRGHWNAGNTTKARQWFKRIWTEFPSHSYADDAAYFSARILRAANDSEADNLLKMQVSKWPDGDMAADAHWLKIRPLFDNKRYKDVIAYVDGLKDSGERDLYSTGRLAYFRARAMELNKDPGAEAAYRGVVTAHPMTYYASLAYNRLWASGKRDIVLETFPDPSIVLSSQLQTDRSFLRGMVFVRLGLDGLARLEFQQVQSTPNQDALWQLAYLMHKAQAYPYSHDIARRRIDGWMNRYPSPGKQDRWEIGFPAPFSEQVLRWSESRKIEPHLVWAIMREESGFSPTIESWANARGLLQLMETTAARMAQLDKLNDFEGKQLFDPEINIRLGTRYLQELSENVEGHPVLMIAGYNGGMGNVGRWQKELPSGDLDLWVEDIPFGQTRNYTKRVLQSYWIYAYLYEDQRVPVFSMSVPGFKN